MSEYTTSTGLVVTDRRSHERSIIPRDPGGDPRSYEPNSNAEGPNVPPVSVGPTSSTNAPGNFVMGPLPQAWSGWPEGWTPAWSSASGLADLMSKVSVVYGAIDLVSWVLSTMSPYRMDVQGDVIDDAVWFRNPQPQVFSGWVEAMRQVVTSFMCGEVFLWATSRVDDDPDGAVRTWVVLHPGWVEIELEGQIRHYSMGGLDIPAEDICHIRYHSQPGDGHGHGPLEALARNLLGAAALEKYQALLAGRGGVPWGTISVPGNLSSTQAITLRDNFVAARMSALGAPAVMSGGATLETLTLSPKDMAALDLLQYNEARIAVLLGVPPLLLGLPTGADSLVYQSTTAIYDYFWRSSLRPKVTMIAEAISAWALRDGERMEVNRDEFVRPPLESRAGIWQTLHNIVDPVTGKRVVSVEEIRSAERLDALSVPGSIGVR